MIRGTTHFTSQTTRRALLTLLYWTANGQTMTREQFETVIRNESFKRPPSWCHMRMERMTQRELVWIDDNDIVRLTAKGLWKLEQEERLLYTTLYGRILRAGPMPMENAYLIYRKLVTKYTGRPSGDVSNQCTLLLKRLRHIGAVEYHGGRIWGIRKPRWEQRAEKKQGTKGGEKSWK